MPDVTSQISINGTLQNSSSNNGTASIGGTITADYSTNTASGNLYITDPSNKTDDFTSFTITNNGNNTYTLTASNVGNDTLTFNYTGEAPSSGLNSASAAISGVTYSNPNTQVTASQPTPCFVQGTLIAIERAGVRQAVAVESLRVGDEAVTADGSLHPITWLGQKRLECRNHPLPLEVMPVRVTAHAFGENRPARDLVLSPGHAVCVDLLGEVLIPVKSLINGATIVQEKVNSVVYWHVALAEHSIILAENLPCESYLEMNNIAFFGEGTLAALHPVPDVPHGTHDDFCRPFHTDGALVDLVQQHLIERAKKDLGWTLASSSFAGLHLLVDGRRIDPVIRDLSARFIVPAGAGEALIVSDTVVPRQVGDGIDARSLGICLRCVVVDDGFAEPRMIPIDDVRLSDGFYSVEPDQRRWTAGVATLPGDLWHGLEGDMSVRLDCVCAPLKTWVPPTVIDRATAFAA